MKTSILWAILIAATTTNAAAQPQGRIRGTITDAASGHPLPYATVVILDVNPPVAATTNEQGAFSLPPLPVGRYTLQASSTGYHPSTMHEVPASPAKETIIDFSLKESVVALTEVVVRPETNKDTPLNPMALAGARTLHVEEAARYAGGLDDPARLATSFAGVAGNVTSNSIAIRGNSPQSLQWKLEGVEIPNPSHYPEIGGIGGGILTAFSAQLLANSDFLTGAFPAEYNNALSGVFDMQLRNGNNQRREHTAQVGTLGVEFASEGPFRQGSQASYLFNYRYSAMALAADLVGGALKEAGGMRFQDLSFKLNFPTRRAGVFSLWAIATHDRFREYLPDDLSAYPYIPVEASVSQQMAAAGLSHKLYLSDNAYLKSTLSATYAQNQNTTDTYDLNRQNPQRIQDMQDKNTNLILNTHLNTKFSPRHTNRTGLTLTTLFYNDNYNIAPNYPYANGAPMRNIARAVGNTLLTAAFTQSQYQLNERLTLQAGITAQYFALTRHYTLEPRASLRFQPSPRHSFALATGLHSRHERLDYYFVTTPESGNDPVNKALDFTKALHLTLTYNWHISPNSHLRIEPYYQHLYNVPIVPQTNISIINQTDFYLIHPLANEGQGRNIGIDFTYERYLNRGYYYLLTASLFNSAYRAADPLWRSARYNRRFLANALAGKEWKLGQSKQNALGANLRLNLMGGNYYTPINEPASLAAKRPIEDESRLLAARTPPALIAHITLNYTLNKHRSAHEFGLKILNITGAEDFYYYDYNYQTNQIEKTTTAISIPNIYYKISF
jgi:hypothetical protein